MNEILKKIDELSETQARMHKENKKALEDQSTLFFQKISELSTKIDPVVKIYTDVSGTGRVLKWAFIVLTAIGGAIITVKQIWHIKT